MTIARRFKGWFDHKHKKTVNVYDVLTRKTDGELYVVKGFCALDPSKPDRLKVLPWKSRTTGVPEIVEASEFNVEYR